MSSSKGFERRSNMPPSLKGAKTAGVIACDPGIPLVGPAGREPTASGLSNGQAAKRPGSELLPDP